MPYHPRANGQTEKTNGIVCKIITKIVQGSSTNWDERIFYALLAYGTTYKVITKSTPFQLVYSQEVVLTIELELQSLCIAIDPRLGDRESLEHLYAMLETLDKGRVQAYLNMVTIQNQGCQDVLTS